MLDLASQQSPDVQHWSRQVMGCLVHGMPDKIGSTDMDSDQPQLSLDDLPNWATDKSMGVQ